jgi:hypothetical protein
MTTDDDLFAQLGQANDRIEGARARLEAANVAQGLPAESVVISGEDAITAAKELQAAIRWQSEIIDVMAQR